MLLKVVLLVTLSTAVADDQAAGHHAGGHGSPISKDPNVKMILVVSLRNISYRTKIFSYL